MTALEALGLLFILYMALAGLAAHIYAIKSGAARIKQHLDLGRTREDSAVNDSWRAPRISDLTPDQTERLAAR